MRVLVNYQNFKVVITSKQYSLIDILRKILYIIYLKRYFVILVATTSIIFGLFLSKRQGVKYKATTTFVINEDFDKQDISPGGAFYGNNLFELIKSYDVIESTLLMPISFNSKKTNLASYLIKHNYLQSKQIIKKELFFENATSKHLTKEQALVMKSLHRKLTNFENFKIGVNERGQVLPSIDIYNSDKFFAKKFSEQLFVEINRRFNLEKQKRKNKDFDDLNYFNDATQNQINNLINNELVSNVFKINKSKSTNMTSNILIKNDLQNMTQSLILNKSNLLQVNISKYKQVELFQIIDTPGYPLTKVEPPFLKYTITFTIFFLISTIFFLGIFMKK